MSTHGFVVWIPHPDPHPSFFARLSLDAISFLLSFFLAAVSSIYFVADRYVGAKYALLQLILKISHPPAPLLLLFRKKSRSATCSAQNALTAVHCRFLLRCPALVAVNKPPCQSSTAAPTNPRCIPHRGRSDVLPAFCELQGFNSHLRNRKNIFFMWLRQKSGCVR